ncbi:hypothetical protein [Hymenobacter crusticola]|uniref:Uncharacterized protein n=1 Tax=Hymenobacter crusticola TaxID=1770526 RepID=A0A243WB26_9BACT|nr:hypothetical protein [Hymenobacter crusticola]OUJ72800.1 hypothetical protein BXP70_15910 [Hymenobacter crusticola]
MQTLRSRLALVLLLCFVRVLLPEAWVLSLHAHQHTTEEPTQTPGTLRGKLVLSAKHQHCDVDHFCNIPFQPAPFFELEKLVLQAYQRTIAVALIRAGEVTPPAIDYLRGPPFQS